MRERLCCCCSAVAAAVLPVSCHACCFCPAVARLLPPPPRQLAHIGQLRIEDEGEEEEWVDPSGGLLVNIYAACEDGDTEKLAINLADLQQTEHSIDTPGMQQWHEGCACSYPGVVR